MSIKKKLRQTARSWPVGRGVEEPERDTKPLLEVSNQNQ